VSERPAAELLPPNAGGRQFIAERTVRLGDVDVSGELRLDAIARYLQDVASDDALDADLSNAMGWVVRRTMIRVDRPSTLNERVALTTFCTGAGRSWAERRTTISGNGGVAVEAVSLWVQVDAVSGRPARLGAGFFDLYGEAAAGRTVSSKLGLAGPPSDGESQTWRFRETDLDPFDHVNNAAQWAVSESLLGGRSRLGTTELEYLAPIGSGELDLIVAGDAAWLVEGGRTLSAFAHSPPGELDAAIR
jgi:acyl-ACP thioesterase